VVDDDDDDIDDDARLVITAVPVSVKIKLAGRLVGRVTDASCASVMVGCMPNSMLWI
jgi:hypothetical protein